MESNTEPEPKPVAPQVPETKERLSLGFLVADDDEDNRYLFGMFLKSMGHTVKAVDDGQQLIDELNGSEGYDVVLSDNTMPGKTGVEALEEIRSIEKFKTLPFIIATTDSSPDGSLLKKIVALGGFYLSKPFTSEQLSSAVEEVTKSKG